TAVAPGADGVAGEAGWATGILEVIVLAVNLTTLFRADSRSWRMLAVFVTLIAVAAIVSTYHVFNNMYDEPAHLAAGMEWLARGTYTYEPQHPRLDRIAPEIGPAAMMPAALLVWTLWLEQPTTKRSVALGVLVAVCGLTKFNAVAYWLPAAIAVAVFTVFTARRDLLWLGGLKLARPLAIAMAVAAFVTWATYRFSVGK